MPALLIEQGRKKNLRRRHRQEQHQILRAGSWVRAGEEPWKRQRMHGLTKRV